MRADLSIAATAALALGTLACLDSGLTPRHEPMCEQTADCADGETCDQGICWGNPPKDARFAAVLVPPEGRTDLVTTHVDTLALGDDGSVGGMSFAEQVTIRGRVLIACGPDSGASCDPERSVAAQIQVRRASPIPGGPTYRRTVIAQGGAPVRTAAFTLRLPRLSADDAPYEVTIVPDDGTVEASSNDFTPAELAPPIRIPLDATASLDEVEWVLGAPEDHKIVRGRVLDAAGRGIPGMRVWALGRWNIWSSLERGSSTSTTDEDGAFQLRVPIAMLNTIDLVVRPAPGKKAPTLRRLKLVVPDPEPGADDNVIHIDDVRMPSYAEPVPYVLSVQGYDSTGDAVAVAGAEVQLTSTLSDPDDLNTRATYTAQGFTNESGTVEIDLIPGGGVQNRIYVARITPPPASRHAALFDLPIAVGLPNVGGESWLPLLTLDRRVPVDGVVVSHDGVPLGGATIEARPSLALRWTLEPEVLSVLDGLQFPSVVSDDRGTFVLWMDPVLLGVDAAYDLDLIPPAGAHAPRWSRDGVRMAERELGGRLDLGEIVLPRASYARGPVLDPGGEPVPGAEVRLYQVDEDQTACNAPNAPGGDGECQAPARLRGVWQSRDSGEAWLLLPNPDAL
jgi:hypothetical protein